MCGAVLIRHRVSAPCKAARGLMGSSVLCLSCMTDSGLLNETRTNAFYSVQFVDVTFICIKEQCDTEQAGAGGGSLLAPDGQPFLLTRLCLFHWPKSLSLQWTQDKPKSTFLVKLKQAEVLTSHKHFLQSHLSPLDGPPCP